MNYAFASPARVGAKRRFGVVPHKVTQQTPRERGPWRLKAELDEPAVALLEGWTERREGRGRRRTRRYFCPGCSIPSLFEAAEK